jgi:hypothetical protein
MLINKQEKKELADKIEAQINKRLLSQINDNELKQWHKEIFNKDIKEGCNGCYNEAFYNILKFIKLNK